MGYTDCDMSPVLVLVTVSPVLVPVGVPLAFFGTLIGHSGTALHSTVLVVWSCTSTSTVLYKYQYQYWYSISSSNSSVLLPLPVVQYCTSTACFCGAAAGS
jgi:hypothetical protein